MNKIELVMRRDFIQNRMPFAHTDTVPAHVRNLEAFILLRKNGPGKQLATRMTSYVYGPKEKPLFTSREA